MLTARIGIRIWTALSIVTLATGCTTISDVWEGGLFSSDEPAKEEKPVVLYETEKPFERVAPAKETKPAPVVRKKAPGQKTVRLPSFMPPWGALTPVGTLGRFDAGRHLRGRTLGLLQRGSPQGGRARVHPDASSLFERFGRIRADVRQRPRHERLEHAR